MSTLVTTALRHNASASNNMVLDSSGRVGIGTATPSRKLEVFNPGTTSTDLAVRNEAVTLTNFVDSGAGYVVCTTNHPLIFATNNIERMRIDSAGRVTTPAQPAFFAYPNTNGNLGSGTFAFSLTAFNIGSHYNTSNGRFTAPVAGVYHFSYGIQHNASVSDNNWTDLQVNSSQYMSVVRGELFTSSTFHIVTASATIYLNASDFVTISSAGTGWGDNSWFSGHLVG